jgi:hypothetical protein
MVIRASVLDCASPLALWSGPSNERVLGVGRGLKFFQGILIRVISPVRFQPGSG